ncbi:MAG: metallopeptidase TldD-related protein [Christensenellaceae bacterium]
MRTEIIVEKTTSTCFNITASRIDSMRKNTDVATSVRVYDGERIGVAGKIGAADIGELTRQAEANLAFGIPYPSIPDPDFVKSADRYREIIPAEEMVPKMKALVDRLARENPDFLFGNKIIFEELEKSYTSGERMLFYRANNFTVSMTIKYKGSANIMDESYEGVFTSYDEDTIARGVKTVCDSFLKRAALPEEDEAIFLVDRSVLNMAVQHFVADAYCNHFSLFDGKLGEKIFSERLTVACNRSEEGKRIVPFFDAEGRIPEGGKAYLIRNGVFESVIANKRHVAQYGVEAKGMAGASYDSVPSISGEGIDVEVTHQRLEDLGLQGKMILVTGTSGGDSTADGTVSLPIITSYLVEEGKIVGRLPEYALTGNLKEIFGDNFIGAIRESLIAGGDPCLVFRAKIVNRGE